MAKGAYIGVPTPQGIGNLAVGSTVKLNVNGTATDFIIVHQGNPDASMYDSSCNGTWLLMKDCYGSVAWNKGDFNNDYQNSNMHAYLNGTFLGLLDSNVQGAIKQVKIPYVNGNGYDGSVASGADGLSTKIFLLSGYEVGWTKSDSDLLFPVGAKLDYFIAGNTTDAKNKRIAYVNGTAVVWPLRCIPVNNTQYSTGVWINGDYVSLSNVPVNNSHPIRPAFILPSSLAYDNNGLITGAEGEVKSIARKIKGGYIGIEGKIYPNSVGLLPVGSTVKINENGSPVDYLVVHQGNPNPTMYDASCDGTWVLRKDIFSEDYWDTNGSNDYENSTIHPYLNGDFFDLFDSDIKSAIKQVKIPYREGTRSSSIASGSNGLSTKIFLLSGYEVGWTTSDNSYLPVDGAKLDYFLSGTTTDAKNLRIAYLDGTVTPWWLRSPSTGSRYFIFAVNVIGNLSDSVMSDSRAGYGIRPAFILPSSLSLTNGVVTGAQAEYVTQGIARKIKKAYIGIGGVARPCWSGGELEYYGTITALSGGRYEHAAASTANYALFGGDGSTVDAYNATLTRSNPSALSQSRRNLAATAHNGSVLFGGGQNVENLNYANIVDRYDASLTRSTLTKLTYRATYCAATSVGEYALFAGGCDNFPSGDKFSTANAYNLSFTQSVPTALSQARYNLAATTVGEYALFGGGYNENYSNVVDTYNTALTKSTATTLQSARVYMAATAVGNYALFGGGGGIGKSTVVDAYNTSLTRTNPTVLSVGRIKLAATTVGTFAVFGGGQLSHSDYSDVVDIYDESLTRTVGTTLSIKRYNLAATSIGNYALFGGGYANGTSNVVDAYVVA